MLLLLYEVCGNTLVLDCFFCKSWEIMRQQVDTWSSLVTLWLPHVKDVPRGKEILKYVFGACCVLFVLSFISSQKDIFKTFHKMFISVLGSVCVEVLKVIVGNIQKCWLKERITCINITYRPLGASVSAKTLQYAVAPLYVVSYACYLTLCWT